MKTLAKKLLTTNTGRALCDSGDAYGRHWERNQGVDFENQPTAWADLSDGSEIIATASIYHWLTTRFELDSLCRRFNAIPCDDWDSDAAYGLSSAGEQWLKAQGIGIGKSFNSYNGENDLSQVIQGAPLHLQQESKYCYLAGYYLLQIHNGCDVRGGYTDAVMVKAIDPDYITVCGNVCGTVNGVQVDNMYNGYCLTDENGEKIIYHNGDDVEVWLMEF